MADERDAEAHMDADALYQEEMFTDRRVGALRRLTPVKRDGSPDTARPTLFVVRPDAYVAATSEPPDPGTLTRYLTRVFGWNGSTS